MIEDFKKYQAQTGPLPLALEIKSAKGSYIYDVNGHRYIDFVAGVSANALGHQPPAVTNAIIEQLNKYTHVMVYGEFIQEKPLALAKLIAAHLPEPLQSIYLTNSGTEATEGALKLAKRITGRSEIVSAVNAYHGNTMGAMSIAGNESSKAAFRPLIPGTKFINYNKKEDLNKITYRTAAVVLETIQGGGGFIVPDDGYLRAVKERCDEMGALLILDEIQSGLGRTGKLFEFMNHDIVPDIIITGKGLGGGMPIGAFIASKKHMDYLSNNPKMGHITTFGGHPVIAAAAYATLDQILHDGLMDKIKEKENLIRHTLKHPAINEIRGKGLMLALMVDTPQLATKIIMKALEKGLILFWLLFEGRAVRITPPLNISMEDLQEGCDILLEVINDISNE